MGKMTLGVIDIGLGNIGSITNMIRYLGFEYSLVTDAEQIHFCDKLILPGVGHFDHAMSLLQERHLVAPLNTFALELSRPILGICLGMQLLFDSSEEGTKPGLGWIAGSVKSLKKKVPMMKIPHMGWNHIEVTRPSQLYRDVVAKRRFYFVHSFYVECASEKHSTASVTYGSNFTVSVEKDSIYGVQFHPERSHKYGLALLNNFASLETV